MKVHLISIGGAVMHNLALELQRNGHQVSGSDDEIFEPSRSRLKSAGLLPESMGWNANNITEDIDVVVLGMHAKSDNPELVKARKLNLKIQSFPQFVAERSVDKTRVVIAGSHGKTTTTAMVMHVLQKEQREFDYLVGSKLDGFELMVKLSDAPLIILEGDEYLSSALDLNPKFLWYKPQISAITGIAWDHMNVFPTYENYVHQFDRYLSTIPDGGVVFYFEGDNDLKAVCEQHDEISTIPYFTPKYQVNDDQVEVIIDGRGYQMSVFGAHNFSNMSAAVNVCKKLGISAKSSWNHLQSFLGTAKRLEPMEIEGVTAFRDFAHSPSKVKATIDAVRNRYPDRKLVAALELHTYSSLSESFLPQFRNTMNQADHALVYFNPHALEMKRLPMISDKFVKDSFGEVEVLTDTQELRETVVANNRANTVFLFMSSGNWGGLKWDELL